MDKARLPHQRGWGELSQGARARLRDHRGSGALRRFSRAGPVECGEYLLARAEGAIPDTHIRAEIGEVLAGAKRGRSDAKAITVFKSLGLAVEDLAAADRAIRNAQDLGLGECVSW